MKSLFNDQTIKIDCPRCKAKLPVKVHDIRASRPVYCSSCRTDIPVDGRKFDRDLRKLDGETEKLQKTLKDLSSTFKIQL